MTQPYKLMGWHLIESAPHDGTKIQIKTHGGYELDAYYDALGSMDENEDVCGQWVAAKEDIHPECWTDGACWAINADYKCSDQPQYWRAPQ